MDVVTGSLASHAPEVSQTQHSMEASEVPSPTDTHAESSFFGTPQDVAGGLGAATQPPAGNVLAADLLSALLPLPTTGMTILRAAAGRLRRCAEQLAASLARGYRS